jgi:DNA-binding MarR family transcriptional regulator
MEADSLLRQVDGKDGAEFTAEARACFFYIACCDGCYKSKMEEDLGLTVASGSRNTDLLSKHHRLKLPSGQPRPGLDLIRKERDNLDHRKQRLFLTFKGKKLIEQFKSILYGEDTDLG